MRSKKGPLTIGEKKESVMKNIAVFVLAGLLVMTAVGCDNVEDAGHDVVDTVKDAVN